jgi:hypothetical protein
MGIFGKKSSSTFEQPSCVVNVTVKQEPATLPNPDPSNYKIVKLEQHGSYLLMLINYPDCTNYEGNKILLYKDVTLAKLMFQKVLDPHFCGNKKYHSPIARFEPTQFGWDCGVRLMKNIERLV